jgi:hypothetical protein
MNLQKKDFGKENRRKSKNEIIDDDTGLLFYLLFISKRIEKSSTNGNREI